MQVMYTDSSLVTSAPTGSGKTVIFELAIVRLLMRRSGDMATGKIVYGMLARGCGYGNGILARGVALGKMVYDSMHVTMWGPGSCAYYM